MGQALGIMAGIGAIGAGGSSILSGISKSKELKFQANQAEQQARLENLRALEQANIIREKLKADTALANAAFGARGMSPVAGSAGAVVDRAITGAELDAQTSIFGGEVNAIQLRNQAKQYRSSARSAMLSGFIGGVGGLSGAYNAYTGGIRQGISSQSSPLDLFKNKTR